jgi:putative transposase
VEDAALLARIETVFAASHQTYGSPRVHAELLATGDAPSVHGVARVMRTAGLRATRARRF